MRFLPKIRRSEEDVGVRFSGLTHCITSPLLLPITLVYFCAKHVVDKYCLLYVRPHTLKNSGAFASTRQPTNHTNRHDHALAGNHICRQALADT